MTGDYTGNAGTSRIDLAAAGTAVGQFARMQVNGTATLGGRLRATFRPPFAPVAGDRFDVLTATSVVGSFAEVVTVNSGAVVATTAGGVVTLEVTSESSQDVHWDEVARSLDSGFLSLLARLPAFADLFDFSRSNRPDPRIRPSSART